jgi:hypothetical protein
MRQSSPLADRVFFSLAGLWFVILTVVGFSPSFYFRVLPEPLPTHQIVHGVVYSTWVMLFLVQALLIFTHRVRWHVTLGAASLFLLILMIPVGFHVVLVKTAAGFKSVDEAGQPHWIDTWLYLRVCRPRKPQAALRPQTADAVRNPDANGRGGGPRRARFGARTGTGLPQTPRPYSRHRPGRL